MTAGRATAEAGVGTGAGAAAGFSDAEYEAKGAAVVDRAAALAETLTFQLDELRYEYPEDLVPPHLSPTRYLRQLTMEGAAQRWPDSARTIWTTLIFVLGSPLTVLASSSSGAASESNGGGSLRWLARIPMGDGALKGGRPVTRWKMTAPRL